MLRKKNKHNNILLVLLIFSISLVIVFIGVGIYNHQLSPNIEPRNYKAEVLMHIAPNMESRTPTQKDIDTQLNLQTTDGKVYRLFESRDMISYGKTFVVRIK